jgi:cell division protein FtsB
VRHAYAVRKPVLNAYLVRQRDRRRLRELLQVSAVILALGGCVLGYVRLHVELLKAGYRVEELEVRLREAQRRERFLMLDVKYLERPELVERRATDELGMVRPDPARMVFEGEIR